MAASTAVGQSQAQQPGHATRQSAWLACWANVPALAVPALQEERQRGFFDDSGNYVEREDKDEEDIAQDAWLQSDEGTQH
jgi:hypothetical protein